LNHHWSSIGKGRKAKFDLNLGKSAIYSRKHPQTTLNTMAERGNQNLEHNLGTSPIDDASFSLAKNGSTGLA
jgi:hypothetical protein